MKILKCARYVGTMIGPGGYLHSWAAPRRKTIQRTRKINESTKSLVERWVGFKIYALSVLGYQGAISTPDEATLKEEAHALQCITAGTFIAVPTTCGVGLDVFGIHILSLAARYRTAVNSGTLVNGLAKNRAAREYDSAPIYALTSDRKDKFLKTSTAHSTMEAFEYVSQMDHADKIPDSPGDKKQKAATALLGDRIQKRNFAIPFDCCTCSQSLRTDH